MMHLNSAAFFTHYQLADTDIHTIHTGGVHGLALGLTSPPYLRGHRDPNTNLSFTKGRPRAL